MKKILCIACALVVFSASNAFAACTPEEFQKEALAMQQSLTEVAKDQAKLEKMNADMEGLFADDLKELEAMGADQAKAQTVEGAQAILDKSCELYKKMNAKIAEYK